MVLRYTDDALDEGRLYFHRDNGLDDTGEIYTTTDDDR